MTELVDFEQGPARELLTAVSQSLYNKSRLDARWLVGLACGMDSPVMGHQDIGLSQAQKQKLTELIEKRNAGCPISRMRGKREFWSQDFYLNSATLDPRPDSETLISAVLEEARGQLCDQSLLHILDLGCGSGCLLLSILSELAHADGLGIDSAALAVAQARANAAALGLASRARIEMGNWADGLTGPFHVIVCNPPYIEAGDESLSDEVRLYDPENALFAGKDGLSAYRALLPQLGSILADNGRVFLELGYGQLDAVSLLAADSGLIADSVYPDLAGTDRCLSLRK